VKDEALLEKPVSVGAEASFTPISLISDCGRQACTMQADSIFSSNFGARHELAKALVWGLYSYFLFWKTGTFSLRSNV
jgi:hypothetical protein